MNTITVIGTQPPCPRCGLLTHVLEEKVKELSLDAKVQHWAFTSEEAQNFARNLGLEAGTAKDVSKKTGQKLDQGKITYLMVNEKIAQNSEYKKYNHFNWSFELDEAIRPFEKLAQEAGILMTPAIIINGQLKHQGSVPRINTLSNWLLQLK